MGQRTRVRRVQATAISVTLIVAVLYVLPLGEGSATRISVASSLATGVIMIGALGWAARTNDGPDRLPWIVTLCIYATGMTLYAIDPIDPDDPAGALTAANLVGPLATGAQIAVVGVLGRRVISGRLSVISLDTIWIGSASLVLSWHFVAEPVLDADIDGLQQAAILVQLVAFALLIGLVAAILPHLYWRRGVIYVFLCAPALLLALALAAQARVAALDDVEPGTFADFLFPLAFGVGTVAILESRRAATITPRPRPSPSGEVLIALAPLTLWIVLLVLDWSGVAELNELPALVIGVLAVVRLLLLLHENHKLTDDLHHRVVHDELTGVPNRTALAHLIDSFGRGPAAVLLIDLDRFKAVNDTFGHRAGDELLVQVAQTIEDEVGSEWLVARLSGDEFVVAGQHRRTHDQLRHLGEAIIERLSEPFEVRSREVWVGATIGAATTEDRLTPHELLEAADTALRHAKRDARGQVHSIVGDYRAATARSRETEDALRVGIGRGELFCVYQPKVDLSDGSLLGFEALVRWNRPGHGVVTPDRFIEVAEVSGLITRVDEWMLKAALHELARWNVATGSSDLSLSVNMSAWQLSRTDVHDAVAATIEHNGRVEPHQVTLELTETALVETPEVVEMRLRRLRDTGVKIAIDDFGAGFTAIAYLRQFPVAEVKIDRTLVSLLTESDASHSLAAAVIALGEAMELDVIAEGVETPTQASALRALGCRSAQGYLFSEPLTADQAVQLAAAQDHRFDVAGSRPTPAAATRGRVRP